MTAETGAGNRSVPASSHGNLNGFKVEEVLNDDSGTKTATVLGRFEGREGQAVVTFSRRHFDTNCLQSLAEGTSFEYQQFENDIYSKYTAAVPAAAALINVDITHPANEKHISKARRQEYFLVKETPQVYQEVTLPFIESLPASRITWVHNILDKKAEADRLVFEDPDPEYGFMLHPDLKWDKAQPGALYCIALCHTRSIRSLRDLTGEHLPLLRNIREKSSKAIQQEFGVSQDQLQMYVHYQPSYYHFHVHIVNVNVASTSGANVGKAHLLDDIIDNVQSFGSDFYQRKTLTFSLGGNDPLMEHLRKRKASSVSVGE